MKLRRIAKSSVVVAAVALLGVGVAGMIAIAILTSESGSEFTPAAESRQAPIHTVAVESTPTPTAAPTLAAGPRPTPTATLAVIVESRSAPTTVPVESTPTPTVVPTVTVEPTSKPTATSTASIESTPIPTATPNATVVPTATVEPTATPVSAKTSSVNPTATPIQEPPKVLELPKKPEKSTLQPDRPGTGAESLGKGAGQGAVFTWEDGDATRRVVLQDDLVVQETTSNTPDDLVVAKMGADSVVRRQPRHDDNSLPVFRSESGGGLMALPGGVLLALDPEWDQAGINSFFSGNGISKDRTSELSFIENGFLVETEPGFPSLNLANELASRDGVIISSPNWWREAQPK